MICENVKINKPTKITLVKYKKACKFKYVRLTLLRADVHVLGISVIVCCLVQPSRI